MAAHTLETDRKLLWRYYIDDEEEHTQTWLDMQAAGYDMTRLEYLFVNRVYNEDDLQRYWHMG